MYFLVGVVGFLVFAYARGYMEGDVRYTWFFACFTLFAGGMLVLVSAPNLLQLIVGWEAHAEDVAALVHAHPTQNEALGEAHLALAGKPLHAHN